MLEDHNPEAAEAPTGMQRRSVVKAGANLAWAVPAITLASAAPALAASTGTPVVTPPDSSTTTKGGGTVVVAKLSSLTVDGAPITNVMYTVSAPKKFNVTISEQSAKFWKPVNAGKGAIVYVLRDGVVRPGEQIPAISFKVTKRNGDKVETGSLSYVLTADAKRRGDADPAPVTGTISL